MEDDDVSLESTLDIEKHNTQLVENMVLSIDPHVSIIKEEEASSSLAPSFSRFQVNLS